MKKIDLIDSGRQVKKLTFILLCKNNEKYLNFLLPQLEYLEKRYSIDFYYLIVENGSDDGSQNMIRSFLHARDGLLLNPGNTIELNKMNRIERISKLRNLSKIYLNQVDYEWAILLDSDIYFNLNFLEEMFATNPSENKVGMLCAFGLAGIRNQEGQWLSLNHYYDTSAFLMRENSKSTWPKCSFPDCLECTGEKEQLDGKLLKVYSAFGGLALVKKDILDNLLINWRPITLNGSPPNEHLNFCKLTNEESDLTIAIAL